MAHFEWVKYMVCELYLNKTVIEEKEITQKKLRMLTAYTR